LASAYRLLRGDAVPHTVLTCEHATPLMPRKIRCSESQRRRLGEHWGWDRGAWDVCKELHAVLRAPAVGSRLSRLWIDLNRAIGDASMFRAEVGGVQLPWNDPPSITERRHRIDTVYRPYHDAIDRVLSDALLRDGRPLVFSVHSFTSRLGRRRRAFDIGILYHRSPAAAQRMVRHFRQAGLRVRYNEPYSGREGMMYSAERHAATFGLDCLELECNQELFKRVDASRRIAKIAGNALRQIHASR